MSLIVAVNDVNIMGRVSHKTYDRGFTYFRTKKVKLIQLDDDHAHLHVTGRQEYCVDIFIDSFNDVEGECNCPADGSFDYHCKHVVAAMLFLQSSEFKQSKKIWKQQLEKGLLAEKYRRATIDNRAFIVVFSLQQDQYRSTFSIVPYRIMAAKLPNRLLDTKKISSEQIVKYLLSNQEAEKYAKVVKSHLNVDRSLNCPPALIAFVNSIVASPYYSYGGSYYESDMLKNWQAIAALGGVLFRGNNKTPFASYLETSVYPVKSQIALTQSEKGLRLAVHAASGDKTIDVASSKNCR